MPWRQCRRRSTAFAHASGPVSRPAINFGCCAATVGAGLPANAMLNVPTHSRVNPLPQVRCKPEKSAHGLYDQ
ncbi:hypothetical protein DMX06_06555 [Pseudomonas mosselii]|nr:hypothetical protein DMX06_06555 [Pseudomonas mosselii]